jgi:hypothetical protein
MKPIDNPYDYSLNQSGDDLKRFSDILVTRFKGKVIEIYIGDQYETLNFEDSSQPQNCIIYGRLLDILDRFILLDCFFIDKNHNLKTNNLIYINLFQIRVMTELNSNGSLSDIFLSAKDSEKIKKALMQAGIK